MVFVRVQHLFAKMCLRYVTTISLIKTKRLKTIAQFQWKNCQTGHRTICISLKCHRLFRKKIECKPILDGSDDNWQKRHKHVLVLGVRVCVFTILMLNPPQLPNQTHTQKNVQQDDTQAIWFWHFHYYFQIKHTISCPLQFFFFFLLSTTKIVWIHLSCDREKKIQLNKYNYWRIFDLEYIFVVIKLYHWNRSRKLKVISEVIP